MYFSSTTETVINSKYDIGKSFQEILCRIGDWINEESGWIIESMNGEYVNISIYSPLSGSSYTELLVKLRNSRKSLIKVWFILFIYQIKSLKTLWISC